MPLEHWYPNPEDNFGIVEEIINDYDDDPEDFLIRCTKIGTFHRDCVQGEMPKTGDKVEFFTDNPDGGWVLKKVD